MSPTIVTGVFPSRSSRMATARALRYSASFSAYWHPLVLSVLTSAMSASNSSALSAYRSCTYTTAHDGAAQQPGALTNSSY